MHSAMELAGDAPMAAMRGGSLRPPPVLASWYPGTVELPVPVGGTLECNAASADRHSTKPAGGQEAI
jgi:hypothetical protein